MDNEERSPFMMPVTRLRGIGEGRAARLAARGIETLRDLIYHLPLRYEDRRRVTLISSAADGENAVVRGRVTAAGENGPFRGRGRRFNVVVRDPSGCIELVWFNYNGAHLSRLVVKDSELWVYGRVDLSSGAPRMYHPDIMPTGGGRDDDFLRILPVYPTVPGCSPRMLRAAVEQALAEVFPVLADPVPPGTTERLGLPTLSGALEALHRPLAQSPVDLVNARRSPAHRRSLFDRFLALMLAVQSRALSRGRLSGSPCPTPEDFIFRVQEWLPFRLTGSQAGAAAEILADMSRPSPMSRLLQGDVGCGKTVVAALAVHAAAVNGFQSAIMAPTQVLASQHFDYFSRLPRQFGFRPVLLTASTAGSERLRILERIADGSHNPVIGTQSLIQTGPVFRSLGLAVIDEQHRFGVRQRRLLDEKGNNPHVLVMSATPIPRTLAMTLHADLDISVITRLPEGRMPVVTRVAGPKDKKDLYRSLLTRLSAGQQAMVVCPVVEGCEDSDLKSAEEMYSALRRLLGSRFRIGLVHGRLPADRKDDVMEKFRNGRVDLLVGTTVMEVGLHAPGATMIIVEHPERFGLAQLHQLRGRVGRGGAGGVCVLMCSEDPSTEVLNRLSILTECSDGFKIAEHDMRMRGHGELTGVRQAGSGEVDIREIFREPALLEAARDAAADILGRNPPPTKKPRGSRSGIQI